MLHGNLFPIRLAGPASHFSHHANRFESVLPEQPLHQSHSSHSYPVDDASARGGRGPPPLPRERAPPRPGSGAARGSRRFGGSGT